MEQRPYRLYISYSTKDRKLFEQLSIDLMRVGIVNFSEANDTYDGHSSSNFTKNLSETDGFLALLTPNSINSEFGLNQIQLAQKLNKLLILVVYGNFEVPSFFNQLNIVRWRDNYVQIINEIKRIVENSGKESSNLKGTTSLKTSIKPGPRKKKPASQNYWLLKMNPNTWLIDTYDLGTQTYFNTYYYGNDRPEMELLSQINVGDSVLGYSSGKIQAITCLMEIITPITENLKDGEGFKMVIRSKYDPPIPFQNFQSIYDEISLEFRQRQSPGQLLFSLTEEQFITIVNSPVTIEQESQLSRSYNPSFLTEGNHKATEDQLEFQSDINSFASVIALKNVTPPLAIGLFGNWGSGKSFFMDKLESQINTITKSKEEQYIEHVVQVRFNSWHYSDTNLWASLTTQIFESLHDYAVNKRYGEEAIQDIYKELNITSYQLEETKRKLEFNKSKVTLLEVQKDTVNKNISEKEERLSMWKLGDLMKIVFSDPYIQKKLENIKSEFEEEKLIENIQDLDDKLSEIDSVRSQVVQSFVLLKQNSKGNWIWIWILAAAFALLGWLILGPLKEFINNVIVGGISVTGFIIVWLGNLIQKLSPYFNKIREFYKRLKSIKETVERQKQKAQLYKDDEIRKLETDIKNLQDEKLSLEANQQEAEARKQKLETQLREIGSGKLLTTFLEGKTIDDAYIKQLGIISWIRKDFAKLNELFKTQKAVQDKQNDINASVQIDRIVLYIDDLDRCNEEIVVKVLEAIHLLLAFELFVVIVGVDPRWLNNALSEKYKSLFGQKQSTPSADAVLSGAATSYDYLEKIFQIPFTLKPITKTGREKLIGYLVKNEMTEITVSDSADDKKSGIKKTADTSNVNVITPKKARKTKKETPAEIEKPPAKERLVFSREEIEYMQKISSIFGKTPRTINRYVNIYRIIKAHGSLKAGAEYTQNDYMPIMYVLAMIVGHSANAKELIKDISNAPEKQKFMDFLKKTELEAGFKAILQSNSSDIETILMKDFTKNIELISRFSFRTLIAE